MRLLIVEDNAFLAEITAELLHSLDSCGNVFEVITIVFDLRTAILNISEHDAVLCDGDFPFALGSGSAAENWHLVYEEAQLRGIHFVLYSGSPYALDRARANHTPAISKPAPVEDIFAALMKKTNPLAIRCQQDPVLAIENRKIVGEGRVA